MPQNRSEINLPSKLNAGSNVRRVVMFFYAFLSVSSVVPAAVNLTIVAVEMTSCVLGTNENDN